MGNQWENWAMGERTLVIDLEVVCWKLRRQLFRLQIAAEFFVWYELRSVGGCDATDER